MIRELGRYLAHPDGPTFLIALALAIVALVVVIIVRTGNGHGPKDPRC